MISTDLANLADWCLGIAAKGRALDPDRLLHMAKLLLDLSRQTRHLERVTVVHDEDHGED